MIRALYCNNGTHICTEASIDDFEKYLQSGDGLLWVDFQGEKNETSGPILLNTFKFHPLAVDDALIETHVPKIDDWDDYIYIVLHAISYHREEDHLDNIELDVFIGKNFIVTHHDLPIPSLDRIWGTIPRDERYTKMGADHVLYRLTDELVVDYMAAIESMDEEIETIEDLMFDRPSSALLSRTFALKRSTLRLRRILSPLREVLNKLARDDYKVIDQKDRVYFRDVYDHLVRLHDITESLRDLVGSAQDTYLSVINNRMNDIMKTLTVITTLFMPISFIASFFGMNFFQPVADNLKPWTSNPAFMITMLLVLGIPLFMLAWVRRKGWI
jgi:magnesium transporter